MCNDCTILRKTCINCCWCFCCYCCYCWLDWCWVYCCWVCCCGYCCYYRCFCCVQFVCYRRKGCKPCFLCCVSANILLVICVVGIFCVSWDWAKRIRRRGDGQKWVGWWPKMKKMPKKGTNNVCVALNANTMALMSFVWH